MLMFAFWFRTALTIALVVSGGSCLRRCIAGPGRTRTINRVNDAAYVLMSAVMVPMVWSVAIPDPFGLQLVVFAGAAVWFAVQATGVPLRRAGLRLVEDPASAIDIGPAVVHEHGTPSRTQCLHHVALLVAMIWMLIAVGRTGVAMPSMAMPRTSTVAAGLIGGYCLLAALAWAATTWWSRHATQAGPARGRTGVAISHVAMTTAMGVMLIAMS